MLRWSVAKTKTQKIRKSIFATRQGSKTGILRRRGPQLATQIIIQRRKKSKCKTKNRQKIRLRRLLLPSTFHFVL